MKGRFDLKTKEDKIIDNKKKCFIIMPVGEGGTAIRRAAEGLVDSAIKSVLEELGYEEEVPHRICSSGSITKDVINRILNSELTIANLTGLNPNVMYELGIRHCIKKPVIHVCEIGTELPFDLKVERTIFYKNDMMGIIEFKEKLKDTINTIVGETVKNPVFDAIESEVFFESLNKKPSNGDETQILKYILNSLESLNHTVNLKNVKDRRQINLREYFSYLEMLIEKEKLNLYDVVEIEYLIARLIEYDIFLQRSILRGLLIF